MKTPLISRAAHERAVSGMETEIWDLRRQVKALREREKARMLCMEAVEQAAEESREAQRATEEEAKELRERVRLLREDNQELRHRYDRARAELAKAAREITTLRLMRTALEARLAAPCETE